MLLTMLLVSQLATTCDADAAVQTIASVARVESGFDTLAIHDNTTGASPRAGNEADAARIAGVLIARGHSIDVGLMQINSANLSRLGLSVDDAFDACRSIAAGGRILREGYQQALRVALSRYNTGDASRGFANGYVGRVLAASAALPPLSAPSTPVPPPAMPPAPPRAVIVIDMLHGGQGATEAPAGNLLAGVAVPPPALPQRPAAGPAQLAQATARRVALN